MVRIRRFGIIRTANMAAALYAIMVLFFSLVIALPVALIGIAVTPDGGGAVIGGGVAGILLLALIGTVVYAVIGWVMTAIGCAIYNLVAGWVGGIEVQLESVTPMGGYPGYGVPAAYGAPAGYGGQYGASGQYSAPGQYGSPGQQGAPPASPGTPGSVPPPPGIPG